MCGSVSFESSSYTIEEIEEKYKFNASILSKSEYAMLFIPRSLNICISGTVQFRCSFLMIVSLGPYKANFKQT